MPINCSVARRDIIRTILAVIAISGLTVPPSLADTVKEVRYGTIDGRRPTEISKGLFGLSDTPGMAYTIKLINTSGNIEIDSPNVSFLVGDCVTIAGEGDKTKIARAESHLCLSQAADNSPRVPNKTGLMAQGHDSEECTHARAESASWPPGFGRRRALLRELMLCSQTPKERGLATHPSRQTCAEAWAKVERLPFGPNRAAAREHARVVCR